MFNDLFNAAERGEDYWFGFGVLAGILLLLAIIGGLLALRFVKAGAPPTPELAIEEAKETRKTIEEVRH
jgi:hypothetical protein